MNSNYKVVSYTVNGVPVLGAKPSGSEPDQIMELRNLIDEACSSTQEAFSKVYSLGGTPGGMREEFTKARGLTLKVREKIDVLVRKNPNSP